MAVQKDSMAVAAVSQEHHAEVISRGAIGTRPGDSDQRIRPMPSKSPQLGFVYDAGPCGYWLSRSRTQKGPGCWGVAPSLRPPKAGDRVQTHRRDALQLARLMRSGALPPVSVPQVGDAALRALRRAREEARRDRKTATQRLKALRLRHAIRSPGRAPWGPAPRRWLREGVWPPPAPHIVCHEDSRAVTEHSERLGRRAQQRQDQGQTWRRRPVVDALQALRGGQGTVAVTSVAALGALMRFDTPSQLRSALGLTPSA